MGANLTPEQRVRFTALLTDDRYHNKELLKVKTKDGQIVPFVWNRAQRYVFQRVEEQLRTRGWVRALILKGRQQGMSTWIQGRFYKRVVTQPGRGAFILSHEDKTTGAIWSMVERYHAHYPDSMKPHEGPRGGRALYFDRLDSNYAIATAGTKHTGRGFTFQLFHGSECGFWDNAAEHLAGIGQALPLAAGTEAFLESTANGQGNVFHQRWEAAIRGEDEYIPIFVPWFWQEEYSLPVPEDFHLDAEDQEYMDLYGLTLEQMAWRAHKIRSDFLGDRSFFDQEYPASPELAFRRQVGNPIILLAWIERAKQFRAEAVGKKVLGIDPSDGGKAALALVLRQGKKITHSERVYGLKTMEQVGHCAMRIRQLAPDIINVDAGGVGAGVAARLAEQGFKINPILFGARAYDTDRYAIRRDEMWGEMRGWFEEGFCEIQTDPALVSDLSGPNMTKDSSQRIKVESKDHMQARGLPSPDTGDAAALTFALGLGVGDAKLPDPDRAYDWRALA